MCGDGTMNGDEIEIFFTVEPIVDAILDRKDLPEPIAVLNAADLSPPIIKIPHVFGCKNAQDELFVKVTKNRKEKRP